MAYHMMHTSVYISSLRVKWLTMLCINIMTTNKYITAVNAVTRPPRLSKHSSLYSKFSDNYLDSVEILLCSLTERLL